MTPLSKPISRRTLKPFGHYKRRVVVTLMPGDRIAMRLERDRKHNALIADIADVFRVLAEWKARAALIEKRKNKKGRIHK